MSSVQAGPSHSSQTPTYPHQGQQPQPSGDNKRRAEGDADSVRRLKHPRPPLPPPHVLQALVPDSPAFTDLLKLEQKLDWTILRKKAEINDALGRPTRVKRTLRLFISNTAHDQEWQKPQPEPTPAEHQESTNENAEENSIEKKEGGDGDVTMGNSTTNTTKATEVKPETKKETISPDVDVNTGKGVAGWVMKIEGRLLDSGNARMDRTKRKLSTFLKSVIVEFDNREAPTFPEGNIVEWHAQNLTPPLDGFEIMRRGDQNVNSRIIIHLSHYPERFKVSEPLSSLISMKEGTRSDIINAVWKLVKVVGAQDKDDATIIKPIGGIEKIFPQGKETIAFHQIPEMATRFLTHPDPIVIPYEIQVDKDFNFHHKCFDIPIEIEDPLKSKMSSLVSSLEGKEGKEIVQLEDKVGELAYFARDIKQKKDFLESFASNPQAFIQNWLAAQSRDLDQMLGYQIGTPGLNGGNIREEDLRRSDLFNLPWINEAVTIQESVRMEQERRSKSQVPHHR
ncbi:uncharacterized protein L201_007731 [Kwoniella dendrophila CBS 6074]|uniref:DM2 domain-containing protein n=1 Tax=Kwoniella dendrophila CBS 6074 TaxID=1295534 RepID=A0AAX4K7C5_9TREE